MPDILPSTIDDPTVSATRAGDHYDRFVRLTELPMLALSLLFLAVVVTPVLDTHLSDTWRGALGITDTVIWALFAIEYVTRLILAPKRRSFIWHHIPDLIVVAIPVLRPLRLARLARLARFARVGSLVASGAGRSHSKVQLNVTIQVAITAVMVVFVGSVGMLDVERNAPGSNIHTYGDAVWWALGTVTTVGYGDVYPVTADGRLIAAAVMITGIAVLGVVTAAVASWFVSNLQGIRQEEATEADHTARLEAALAEAIERLSSPATMAGTVPRAFAKARSRRKSNQLAIFVP